MFNSLEIRTNNAMHIWECSSDKMIAMVSIYVLVNTALVGKEKRFELLPEFQLSKFRSL